MSVTEDEERIREELQDLIDDNPIDEDESGSDDDEGKNRKRKKSDDEDELDDGLDEDDYDLLEQNLGVKMDRKVIFFLLVLIHFLKKNYRAETLQTSASH